MPAVAAVPTVTLDCDGTELEACFTSTEYSFESQHLKLSPTCSSVGRSDTRDGVCLSISMPNCRTATEEVHTGQRTLVHRTLVQ
jgi:hypothetical protein